MHKKNIIEVVHSMRTWLPKTQTWLYNQVNFLPTEIKNYIICEKTENLDQFNQPNIRIFPQKPFYLKYLEKKIRLLNIINRNKILCRLVKETQAKIIHSHFGSIGWENIWAARHLKLKHIVTFYGYDVNRLPTVDNRWKKRYKNLFKHVDLILCEGHFMAESINRLGCPEKKLCVHHLGVDIKKIKFIPRVWRPHESLRILIAGSFFEKKGIPFALEAIGQIQNEIDIDMTIIGDAQHNKQESLMEKKKILSIIDKYKLNSKTRLLGYMPHSSFIEEAYKHHVFLSPSITASDGDSEGGAPVSLIEMAASGIPIISTKHCDIPEIIQTGETGFLAEEKNIENIVQHFKWLIANHDNWANILRKGRQKMEREYNATIQGKRLANIYRGLSIN